jgi:hypothetical protein
MDLSEISSRLNLSAEETVARLVPAGAIYFSMDEKDVQRILGFEHTMIGSDGLPHDAAPHPRLWGTFPRVLGHYARGLGLFSLEKAVHKMTGLTAKTFGLADRGAYLPRDLSGGKPGTPSITRHPCSISHRTVRTTGEAEGNGIVTANRYHQPPARPPEVNASYI